MNLYEIAMDVRREMARSEGTDRAESPDGDASPALTPRMHPLQIGSTGYGKTRSLAFGYVPILSDPADPVARNPSQAGAAAESDAPGGTPGAAALDRSLGSEAARDVADDWGV